MFMSEAFTLSLSGNIVWDGCPQKDICLPSFLLPVMTALAISSESDFVLTILMLDRYDTESARETTLTPLFH